MDLLAGVLYVLIGALVGALLVLLVDTFYLGQRLQKAIAAKRQMQAVLRLAEQKLVDSESRERMMAQELAMAHGRSEIGSADGPSDQLELKNARSDIKTLKDNLKRVSNHLDEMREEKQALRQELAAAKARVEAQREYYGRLDSELRELRQRYEESCRELTAAAAAKKMLEKELNLARKKVETASQLEIELHQTRFALKAVEAQFNQLQSRQITRAGGTGDPPQGKSAEPAAESTDKEPSLPATVGEEPEAEHPVVDETKGKEILSEPTASDGQDELERVRGIGPVYARRLHEAGIENLADLANQQPDQVSDVLGLRAGQHDRVIDWIKQAQTLSNG